MQAAARKNLYIVLSATVLVFALMSSLAFREHWLDIVPAQPPLEHQEVPFGTAINLAGTPFAESGTLFLHFTNPGCKCSRAIREHFYGLVRRHAQAVRFGIVLESDDAEQSREDRAQWQRELGELSRHVLFFDDHHGMLAKQVGVFSTPQAAIISRTGRLFFRGSYRMSRYADHGGTPQYAKAALEHIISAPDSTQRLDPGKPIGCIIPGYHHSGHAE